MATSRVALENGSIILQGLLDDLRAPSREFYGFPHGDRRKYAEPWLNHALAIRDLYLRIDSALREKETREGRDVPVRALQAGIQLLCGSLILIDTGNLMIAAEIGNRFSRDPKALIVAAESCLELAKALEKVRVTVGRGAPEVAVPQSESGAAPPPEARKTEAPSLGGVEKKKAHADQHDESFVSPEFETEVECKIDAPDEEWDEIIEARAQRPTAAPAKALGSALKSQGSESVEEKKARALGLLFLDPNRSDRSIAGEVGLDPSTLSRDTKYRGARKAAKGERSDLPAGDLDEDGGLKEAYER